MKIHIVLDCLDYGDGVSSDVLSKAKMINDLGINCSIYSLIYDSRVASLRHDIGELKTTSNDLILHHYSGESKIIDKVLAQPCKKVLIYHNITPPEFMTGEIREHCQRGLEQIKTLKGKYDYYCGDSGFNISSLVKLGVISTGDILPIAVNFQSNLCEKKGSKTLTDGQNILFVGRIVPNKRIEDIISVFDCYRTNFAPSARLTIVGNQGIMPNYTKMITELIAKCSSSSHINFLDKVSDEELKQLYQNSDTYLCMSEHEGFCIPLLEAMSYGLCVFAFDAGAVKETMGDAGVVFTDKNPMLVSQLIDAVMKNMSVLKKIINCQYNRIKYFSYNYISKINEVLINKWIKGDIAQNNMKHVPKKLKIQMQGPFETTYSLALVNRHLIEALHNQKLADVSIHCTEGTGDYSPQISNLSDKQLAKYLWQKEKNFGVPDVAIRNMFPPITTGLTAQYNFQAFGWEEDRIPKQYIDWFNTNLDGIGTTSQFVTTVLKNSGLRIPVKTIGNGVRLPDNFIDLQPYPILSKKKHRFLHISSAFPRKGVDVLLETFFETFTAADDVCLILKTFPNIHNKTVEQLEYLRHKYPLGPEIEHINQDLTEDELFSLYKAATCYVHCARGEGFGLPVAEAMLAKLPTIVCNNSGLADFCTEKTCITIDYKRVQAYSHLSENSNWMEPNRVQLKEKMLDFVNHQEKLNVKEKIKAAHQLILDYYTWEAVAKRWIKFIDEVMNARQCPSVDMVTTWNIKCGIAEFTRYFIENTNKFIKYRIFPNKTNKLIRQDEDFVAHRSWNIGQANDDISELLKELDSSSSQIIHVQYNLGFFSLKALSLICSKLGKKKRIIVVFHATTGIKERLEHDAERNIIINDLNQAYRLIVHQTHDAKCLISLGLKENIIQVIPLGQITYPYRSLSEARAIIGIQSQHIVGSYGFLLPQKGIEKCIRAIAILKNKYPDIIYIASCALYDADISMEYYKKCKETVQELGLSNHVLLFTDFLAPEESIILLQACNVLIMAYDKTRESASGATRFCVAAKRPLITTKQEIFAEFNECSYQIKKNTPEKIAEAVNYLMDESIAFNYSIKLQKKIENTNWHTIGRQYLDLYC